MPKVSVIVPVYNVEKYLRKCLDSILTQTFKDFELILIDDKSPDESGDICDEYAQRDNRIRVIHKENNQGVSAARNDGLDAVRGDYVTFVDSDDWIEPDYIEHLYHLSTENDADIVSATLKYDGDVKNFSRSTGTYEGKAMQRKTALGDNDFYWGTWYSISAVGCKLYSRALIENNGIRFDESLTNGEDSLFYADTMLCSTKCVASTKVLYHYFMRADSASNLKTIKEYAATAKAWYIIMKKMNKRWNSRRDAGRVLQWYLFHYVALLEINKHTKFEEVKILQQMFRSSRKYRHTQGTGAKFDLLYLLLEWNIPLYLKITRSKHSLSK